MKTVISDLIFDKELVSKVKSLQVNKDLLYNQLISGKITMKEFIRLSK